MRLEPAWPAGDPEEEPFENRRNPEEGKETLGLGDVN